MTKSRVVHVDIHGQRYAVRSELDPQYIAELATYLDEKMQMAARELASTDALRVAVIAALNIVDELFHARASTSASEGEWTSRAAAIEQLLDAVLTDARVRAVNQ
ncbi:MAG TPA: cell division protein ZapA [Vicinamibacterales bacterium]|nr:cell division protein ZapA [Vicinamibacterales bacterium]